MRNLIALVIVAFVCATSGTADADLAKAKAANTRGYKLHKKKKFAAAAVEYRNAIKEDPSYLLAHYNLACVASLLKDDDTAIKELAWVIDRATWNKAAYAAAKKASKDKDLKWIRDEREDGIMLTNMEIPNEGVVDLLNKPDPPLVGKKSSATTLLKTMASAPGKHADKCNPNAYAAVYLQDKGGTVAVNLRDGLIVIDPSGKVIARSEPIGCTSARQSITGLTQVRAITRAHNLTDHDLMAMRLIAITYSGAGASYNVAVYALTNDDKLYRAFDAELLTEEGDGTLYLTPLLGNLVYTAPAAKKPAVFRWDVATHKFVPEVR